MSPLALQSLQHQRAMFLSSLLLARPNTTISKSSVVLFVIVTGTLVFLTIARLRFIVISAGSNQNQILRSQSAWIQVSRSKGPPFGSLYFFFPKLPWQFQPIVCVSGQCIFSVIHTHVHTHTHSGHVCVDSWQTRKLLVSPFPSKLRKH